MQEIPHAPGFTLTADAFMRPGELVGFSLEHHYLAVFSHFHDFYELALVLRGTGVHQTAEDAQKVTRGWAVFVAPGLSHGWELCDDMLVYNCFLRADAVRFALSWVERDPLLGRLFSPGGLPPHVPIAQRLEEQAFEACHAELEAIRSRQTTDRNRAFDLGHMLLALEVVARSITGPPDALSSRAPQVIRSAVELVEGDLRRHWTLAALAAEVCTNAFHLVRLFRRWTGVPPIAYANRRRAEHAAALLAGTDMPIAAVGAEVGWSDSTTFARRFRKEFGVNPRTFRLQSGLGEGDRGGEATVAVSRTEVIQSR